MSRAIPPDVSAAARALAARSNAKRSTARREAGKRTLPANRLKRHPYLYAVNEDGRVARLPAESRDPWIAAHPARRPAATRDREVRQAIREGAVLEILDSGH